MRWTDDNETSGVSHTGDWTAGPLPLSLLHRSRMASHPQRCCQRSGTAMRLGSSWSQWADLYGLGRQRQQSGQGGGGSAAPAAVHPHSLLSIRWARLTFIAASYQLHQHTDFASHLNHPLHSFPPVPPSLSARCSARAARRAFSRSNRRHQDRAIMSFLPLPMCPPSSARSHRPWATPSEPHRERMRATRTRH